MPESPQLPYSIEAEQSVLGGLMLGGDAEQTLDVLSVLAEGDFYRADHQRIYRAVKAQVEAGQPADFVTISEFLRARAQLDAAGGLIYLGTLANDCPSAANIRAYADIVAERAALRRMISVGHDIAAMGFRPEGQRVDLLIDRAQGLLMTLSGSGAGSELKPVASQLGEHAARLDARRRGDVRRVSTGLADLDRRLGGGFTRGELIIVAGRPSMGKSALAFGMADRCAARGEHAFVCSMEMPAEQIIDRSIALRSRVPLQVVRDGSFSQGQHDDLTRALASHARQWMTIDDASAQTALQIRARARKAHRRKPVDLLVVDYIQLSAAEGDNRNAELDRFVSGMKALAKDLDCAVVLVSQLSRRVEERPSRRPLMSDLRDSGAIEQHADIVLFPFRPAYYWAGEWDGGYADIDIAKNRNGPLGRVAVAWVGEYCEFTGWAGGDGRLSPSPAPRTPSRGYTGSRVAA